ncbi:SpaH/EbpB family LPXTG-anchored major pilin [Enterococcus sp. AZ007]|uniref:SpaH/EbpB family LPXTG-anchored major pilin n=1 Tax=Enterococcus sp. AZ007 TaxID=2774839 RepID=UPI003F24CF51
MKTKRKWISKTAMTLGVLTMAGSVGAGTINVPSAVAQNISDNAVSDNTSDRSITLWKYEISSSAELGERGDGINPDPSKAPDLNGKKLMAGVNFEIIKVKAIGNSDLTDPLKQVKGTDWEEDTSFTKQTGKTGDGTNGTKLGALTFDVSKDLGANDKKKADGIYLIREIPDANGEYTYVDGNGDTKKITKPMDPFFVHLPQTKRDDTGKLIYDVHVYPKNIVSEIDLDKTVEGGKGYSIKAGNSFQWEATTKLPDGLYAIAPNEMTIPNYVDPDTGQASDRDFAAGDEIYASYFRVLDSINEKLMLEDVEVYAIAKDGTKVQLTNGTEYKVTLDTKEITPPNKVEDLTEGKAKDVVVSLTKAGMKKLGVDEDTHLQVVYKVKTNKDFNGSITNQYKTEHLLPGGTPSTSTSDEPEYFNGGLDIKKTDKAGADLSGAEFHIADSEENAKENIFLASDGKSYRKTAGPGGTPAADTLPNGVTYLTSTSNPSGAANFDGLKLEWFTDSNDNGKQDPEIPSEATFQNREDIKKDYWVVETKSPDGYELLKTPQKVTVTLKSHEDDTIEVTVVNEPKTKLPFTGGTGTMLTIIIAIGAITIGTAAIAIDKKRRHA